MISVFFNNEVKDMNSTSPWRNRIVCYDHKRRQCFDESDNHSKPITIDQAREAYESGTLSDFNLALRQLAIQEWDMERVEEYYREQDPGDPIK